MTKKEYEKIVKALTEDRIEVSEGKRQDYTKGSKDVLSNFKNQAREGGVTPLQSLFIHLEKQISAVFNYIRTGGEHESEPIIKRIGDSINYLELLWGLINDPEVKNWDGVNINKTTIDSSSIFTGVFPEEGDPLDVEDKETGRSMGI